MKQNPSKVGLFNLAATLYHVDVPDTRVEHCVNGISNKARVTGLFINLLLHVHVQNLHMNLHTHRTI